MNTLAIISAANDIKAQIAGLDNRRLYYEIVAVNPQVSNSFATYFKGSNKNEPCAADFAQQLDTLLSNDNIAVIRITARDSRGKQLLCSDLKIKPMFADGAIAQPQQAEEKHQAAILQQQPMPQSQFDLRGVLGLLGVDTASLGTTDDPIGGLGAVLSYRDKMIEKRFEERDRNIELTRLSDECRELKAQIKQLTDETLAKSKEIEQLKDDINDYDLQVAELEKLRPENSIAGVALTGLLASAGQSLLKRNAGLLGRLMGIDKDSMLGMLDNTNDEETAAPRQTVNAADIDIEPQDARSADIDSIKNFMRQVSDTDFAHILDIFRLFAAQRETITALHNYLFKQQQQPQPMPDNKIEAVDFEDEE